MQNVVNITMQQERGLSQSLLKCYNGRNALKEAGDINGFGHCKHI